MADNTQVQALYIAYFARPADPNGLSFWSDGEKSDRASLDALADSISGTPEYVLATAGLSTEAIVNQFYNNMFNRDADLDGLKFWVDAINTGASSAEDIGVEIGLAALDAVVPEGETNADKEAITAKTNSANLCTAEIASSTQGILAYAGPDAVAAGVSWIQPVVNEATELTEADVKTDVNALIESNSVTSTNKLDLTVFSDVASSTNDYVGLSIGTGEIQVSSNFRFTADNQTINGTGTTYNNTDSLTDASTTDNDTLNLDFGGGATAVTTAVVTNIETLNITGSAMTGGFAQNGSNMTGLKSVTVKGDVAGAATALAYTFDNGVTSIDTSGLVGGTGSNADTLTIASAGGADKTIVNGDVGARTGGALIAAATTGITTAGGDDTITSGSGNDYIDAGAGVNTINAGAGTNRIVNLGQSGTADTVINDVASTTAAGVIGTGVVTATASATGLTVTGDGSANTINATTSTSAVALLGGAGADTLTGGTAGDTITGGTANDTILGGTGGDSFVTTTGDSLAQTADVTQANGVITDGDTLTSVLDVISDFNITTDGDTINSSVATPATNFMAVTATAGGNDAAVIGDNCVVRGDYNTTTNVFTVDFVSGADVLFFVPTDTDFDGAGTENFLLSGFGSNFGDISAATFT